MQAVGQKTWLGGAGFAASLLVLFGAVPNPCLAQFSRKPTAPRTAGEDIRSAPGFARYAQILVQLELLSNPATAHLSIVVSSPQPGQLNVAGRVPGERVRQHVLATAKRLSGLKVVDEMQTGDVAKDTTATPKSQLESLTSESLQALFPDLAGRVRAVVKEDGIVTLNGAAPSYEQKLRLSEFVKGQPGCKAVQNLLLVDVDPTTGEVSIDEGGSERIKANKLPSVAPAPIADLTANNDKLTVKELTAVRGQADDAPEAAVLDRQLREEVRNQIDANSELAALEVQIEAADGVVVLSGQFKNRVTVEKLVDTASNAVGVRKIVAKCTPYSMQRSLSAPRRKQAEPAPTKQSTKLLGFIPWMGRGPSEADSSPANARGFREGVRKALKKRCEGRFEKIAVNNTLRGLVIEGEVANARDRTFVLKQVDNMVELRGLNYDVALRVKDSK